NSYAANPQTAHSPLVQYALADRVEYFPKNQEALFSTKGSGRRVLYYDTANDMQVSAPALRIKRDQVTHKDSVKGIGDVRFNFVEHEIDQLEQLRKRFALEKHKV